MNHPVYDIGRRGVNRGVKGQNGRPKFVPPDPSEDKVSRKFTTRTTNPSLVDRALRIPREDLVDLAVELGLASVPVPRGYTMCIHGRIVSIAEVRDGICCMGTD